MKSLQIFSFLLNFLIKLYFLEILILDLKDAYYKNLSIQLIIKIVYWIKFYFILYFRRLNSYFITNIKVMIRGIWSDNVLILSKRTNVNDLYLSKVNIYEKCCTFEGPECYSVEGFIYL